MGIYDRDYIRDAPRQPGRPARGVASALQMWSVNTWIIVICVAVFAIDGFLPPRDVWTGVLVQAPAGVPDSVWKLGSPDLQVVAVEEKLPNGRSEIRHAVVREIVERSTGRPIGFAEVYRMKFLESFLHFSTRLGFQRFEFWRFIGFQFLHASTSHLFFNMMGLYFFGGMVEEYLGSKRYLAFYLLCGIFGALSYLLLNLLGTVAMLYVPAGMHIPGLLFSSGATPLVGASAGIFGVLMAGAYLAPREIVYFFYVLPMKLQTLAYVLVGIAFLTVLFGGQNAGGEAGHLGGALAGFYFIRHPHHLHGFFDFLGRIDPTSHHYRSSRQRPVPGYRSVAQRMEIDRILDKIRREGMHSLTDVERQVLHDASNPGSGR